MAFGALFCKNKTLCYYSVFSFNLTGCKIEALIRDVSSEGGGGGCDHCVCAGWGVFRIKDRMNAF